MNTLCCKARLYIQIHIIIKNQGSQLLSRPASLRKNLGASVHNDKRSGTKHAPCTNKERIVSCFKLVVRICSRYWNQAIKTALRCRARILNRIITDYEDSVKSDKNEHPFGEDVKPVRQRTFIPKLLTPAEKDELPGRYESGMSMAELASIYGCHYTTVGRILRKQGVAIRG
jgi:hypothetical protein